MADSLHAREAKCNGDFIDKKCLERGKERQDRAYQDLLSE